MDAKALEKVVGKWPGVSSDIKWEKDLVFSVAGKMFVVTGTDGGSMSFKVEPGRFLELVQQPGFIAAPYMARSQWVQVAEPAKLPRKELEAMLRRSYELVLARLPKKTQRELAG